MLKWLHSMGCKVDEETFELAARFRTTVTLQWLQGIRCPWNVRTFRAAVEYYPDMDTLVWLRKESAHGMNVFLSWRLSKKM